MVKKKAEEGTEQAAETPGEEKSKSEHIREALAANPDLKTREIVAYLATRGVTVTEGLVHQVKAADKRKSGDGKTSKKASSGFADTLAEIKRVADMVGGFEELSKIADTLAK